MIEGGGPVEIGETLTGGIPRGVGSLTPLGGGGGTYPRSAFAASCFLTTSDSLGGALGAALAA